MPSFETSRRVRHSADAMFDLVADVERYPEFVPMCEKLVVRARRPQPDGNEVLVADMTVGYSLLRETFTSKVTLDRAGRKILVEYLDGPFRQLENRWTFTPADPAGAAGEAPSDVGFFIQYEFRSRTLAAVMGAVFDRAFRKFADAFEARADAVYGAA